MSSSGGNGAGPIDQTFLDGLKWRLVGPHRGGRVVATAGDPVHRQVFYFGACDGGVWKTTDGGITWNNVSDGFFNMAAVGALAVAESDPNVVFAGMGETTIRGDVSHGDGVYRSLDAGKSWKHVGLEDTQAIAKIRIHPKNPDVVYVAALGHIFGPNEERGVYRSTDGGDSWTKILYRGDKAGAIDLSMDPNNPRVLYAAFWEAQRSAHHLNSGGEGSGLFKSTDGGDTWTELTRKPGLPDDLIGKIGVSVSPARPERVWALVESKKGGLFRSDDGGETWKPVNADMDLRQRPWYYMHVFADPKDENVVYVCNLSVYKSTDGGKSVTAIPVPHGDTHDLWIDPNDTKRMINGNDGGACISFDGGVSWSTIYNQPTAQFYHVVTDTQVPYRLYGAQQDNSTLSVPSRTDSGAITFADCFPVGGGESGYIAVRPDNPNIIYAGSYGGLLTRLDHSSGQTRMINPWPDNPMGYPAGALKYRFQWTYPIMLSPHDPNTLYVTSNHVHRTKDEGQSFEVISPDLTRNDPEKLGDSGGDISHDNTSVEYYGTIFAFAESPVQAGVLWAGSDDGLIHVSRDDGQSWENVTPSEMPEWCLISIIEPSPHDAGTAYVAATRYKLDDFTPYIYKTNDFGKSWTRITDGIRANDFARAIREDPQRQGLLFAGTETGLYISLDDGAHWQRFQQNLPVAPVHDIAVKDNDLVVATHGRAFWILDDITPLRQYDGSKAATISAHIFNPSPTIRFRASGWRLSSGGVGRRGFTTGSNGSVATFQKSESETTYFDAGQNPPAGITVSYWLKDKPEGDVTLTVSDSAGNEIQKFGSEKPEKEEGGNEHTPAPKKPLIPKEAGLNRFTWNLRYPDAEFLAGAVMWAGSINGPTAPPGTYRFTVTVDGQTDSTEAKLVADPRSGVNDQDLQEQFNFLLQIRDKVSETHKAIKQLRDIRGQIELWEKRLGDKQATGVTELANEMKKELTEIEEELIQVKSVAREDPLNFPIKLNNKLAAVGSVVTAGDNRPTNQSREVFEQLASHVDEQLEKLQKIAEQDVKEFNAQVREADLPAISEQ